MIILLNNNQVWWTGMKLEYRPKLLPLPYNSMGRVKLLAAGSRTLAVVDEFNKIYMIYDFLPNTIQSIKTGISTSSSEVFGGGNIIALGGRYQNRFAIVD